MAAGPVDPWTVPLSVLVRLGLSRHQLGVLHLLMSLLADSVDLLLSSLVDVLVLLVVHLALDVGEARVEGRHVLGVGNIGCAVETTGLDRFLSPGVGLGESGVNELLRDGVGLFEALLAVVGLLDVGGLERVHMPLLVQSSLSASLGVLERLVDFSVGGVRAVEARVLGREDPRHLLGALGVLCGLESNGGTLAIRARHDFELSAITMQ